MKLSITSLNLDDRPREKFESQGASSLSVAELLAIVIGSGSAEENAVQLMQRIMSGCGNSLATLGRTDLRELCQYKGMGKAKAIALLAVCELASRRMAETSEEQQTFQSAESIFQYFRHEMQNLPTEQSRVLLLNQRLGFISSKLISHGGITGTVVDIRRILREALLSNATNIALCHNHPSGSLRPSSEDDQLTNKLKRAAETMNIRLIDHLIISYEGYYSYQEQGRL